MNPFEIVPFSPEHTARAAELERACFSMPWSAKMLEDELKNPLARYYAALSVGTLAGYIGAHVILGEGYITNVAVDPGFRRRGAASALLRHLERECPDAELLTLEVRLSNAPAVALYARHGFSSAGIRKNYYDLPREDALIMTKLLAGEKGNGYGHSGS